MKKIYLLLSLILCWAYQALAQDTTSYYGKSQYIFQRVDRNQISSGLLSEYGVEFLNLANYNGALLADSNFVGLQEWRLLYASLYSSQIKSPANMLRLDTINNRVLNYIGMNQPISFAVLHYNYNSLCSDAVSANLLRVSNDQLYDVPNRLQSPYQNNNLFAVAPIRQAAVLGANNVIFRPELFFSNTGKTINHIAIATGDATNYQTVPFNTPYAISFAQEGFIDIAIRITYTDASTYYAHTKLLVYPQPDELEGNTLINGSNNQTFRFGGWRTTTNEIVTATTSYLGQFATGDITIQLAEGNTTGQIRKPLIVVEGFDIDNGYNFRNFTERITDNLNDGLDNAHEYDLIFLNFANATDYIQRNAYLLQRVISIVNSRKTTYGGSRQQNVIIGLSMGGLVARYALRNMELNSIAHETRLFISHDTPHHGANVPVGAQAAVQHLAPIKLLTPTFSSSFPWLESIKWEDMFPEIVRANNSFNSPAAKQMLIQRYLLSPLNYKLVVDNSAYTNFYTELNNMGWPLNSKNLTLSNGACNGSKVFADNSRIFEMIGGRPMSYGGQLWRSAVMTAIAPVAPFVVYGGNVNPLSLLIQFPLSLISTKTSVNLDFRINAVPSSGIAELYRGDIFIKRKLVWLINSTSYIMKTRINSVSGMLPLDNAQGGLYDLEEFGVSEDLIKNNLPKFFEGIRSSVLQPRFCFVPTVSSLAISNPWTNLNKNLCETVNCLTPTGVKDYYAPQQNQLHISYTLPSANWILQWQDAGFDCAKICSSTLSIAGPYEICGSETYTIPNLPAGSVVTWSVAPTGVLSYTASGNTATFTKVGYAETAVITATITTPCGNVTTSKYVKPGNYLVIYDRGPICPNTGGNIFSSNQTLTANYLWKLRRTDGSTPRYMMLGERSPRIDLFVYETGTFILSFSLTNSCGVSQTQIPITVVDYGCIGGYPYMVYPNPSSSELKISQKLVEDVGSAKKMGSNIFSVKLLNEKGKILKAGKVNANSREIVLQVADIPNGIYYLHIYEGKNVKKQQVVISH
ncbi:T9SS type A sorting domain-containing protein [Pedobacter chitinilyticus]|uniref:T9SS type A sorting domain-containing protein n=1 Tax=Pedobacter chitinilyticus TaxID=2233776 RepID=A0A443YU23_9SPHI|nr:T9SS type A sorting domain-containing protein [Pedobacter chitinilyticus]RWU07373.1 T9SS type A sorting domain-containing protein [Pedobacter chitinilyticus]